MGEKCGRRGQLCRCDARIALIVGTPSGRFRGWGVSLDLRRRARLVRSALPGSGSWGADADARQPFALRGGALDRLVAQERNVGVSAVEAVSYLAAAVLLTGWHDRARSPATPRSRAPEDGRVISDPWLRGDHGSTRAPSCSNRGQSSDHDRRARCRPKLCLAAIPGWGLAFLSPAVQQAALVEPWSPLEPRVRDDPARPQARANAAYAGPCAAATCHPRSSTAAARYERPRTALTPDVGAPRHQPSSARPAARTAAEHQASAPQLPDRVEPTDEASATP